MAKNKNNTTQGQLFKKPTLAITATYSTPPASRQPPVPRGCRLGYRLVREAERCAPVREMRDGLEGIRRLDGVRREELVGRPTDGADDLDE
jgi:hypothetical protein